MNVNDNSFVSATHSIQNQPTTITFPEYSPVITGNNPVRNPGFEGIKATTVAPDTMNSTEVQKLLDGSFKKVSVFVDCQNDFIPPNENENREAPLGVPGADSKLDAMVDYIESISRGATEADMLVFTYDNHPSNHSSFEDATHPRYTSTEISYADGTKHEQTKWPPHCVQDTDGAKIHPRIAKAVEEMQRKMGNSAPPVVLVPKGEGEAESYSAAESVAGHKLPLSDFIENACTKDANIQLHGFAGDFCVRGTGDSIVKLNHHFNVSLNEETVASVYYTEGHFAPSTKQAQEGYSFNRKVIQHLKAGEMSAERKGEVFKNFNLIKTNTAAMRGITTSVKERISFYEGLKDRV